MNSVRTMLFLLGGATLASCVQDEPPVAQRQSPIINGVACEATELPSSVAILLDTGIKNGTQTGQARALFCTGTLIAPDVVLTAAHCIEEELITGGQVELVNPKFYISFTPDLANFTQPGGGLPTLPADAVLVRESLQQEQFSLTPPAPGLSNFYDIALLFLDTPVTTVRPATLMTESEIAKLKEGATVRIAGWGQQTVDQMGPLGSKYCATTTITEVGDKEIRIGKESTTARKCHGDSGGPTYITIETDAGPEERVIGVTSRAYDSGDCSTGGIDTLAPAWFSWIDAAMTARCDDDSRVWCEEPGVVSPEYYRPGNGGGDTGLCSSGGTSGPLTGLFTLFLLLGLRRRSQRSCKSVAMR